MPVILTPDQEDIWLSNESNEQTELLADMLRQLPKHKMHIYPISTDINSAKNNHPKLLNKV